MFVEQLEREGYVIIHDVLDPVSVQKYISLLLSIPSADGKRGGLRNLLAIKEMRDLADSSEIMSLVHPVLGERAFPVRGILFDKQEGTNWKVPWHQDVTIAVKDRADVQGYGPWSMKDGVQHVQPPGRILEQMVSVRLHLDDCPATNGALRVIAGSHRLGRLDQNYISDNVCSEAEYVCEVKEGGALLMRPLTIHASSIAKEPRHRRVIHFDYANTVLDDNLEWFETSFQG